MNSDNTYYTANDIGEIGCHDATLGQAKHNCEEMMKLHPDDGWEVLGGPDYRIVRILNLYHGQYLSTSPVTVLDDVYDSAREAFKEADNLGSAPYVTDNGEAECPDYIVVRQVVADWLELDDLGKYDWDGCECMQSKPGECCGQCEDCFAHMVAEDEKYVRSHAAERSEIV